MPKYGPISKKIGYDTPSLRKDPWEDWAKYDRDESGIIQSVSAAEYAILRVSQQIYQEASAVLYTESKFWVSYDIGILDREGFSGIGHLVQKLHRVCHLGIDVHQDSDIGYEGQSTVRLISQILAYYSSASASFRSLEISLELGYRRGPESLSLGGLMMNPVLQEENIQRLVSNFKVKEKLEIWMGWKQSDYVIIPSRIYVPQAKDWCGCLAEDKD